MEAWHDLLYRKNRHECDELCIITTETPTTTIPMSLSLTASSFSSDVVPSTVSFDPTFYIPNDYDAVDCVDQEEEAQEE
jgi:hypothetical protein